MKPGDHPEFFRVPAPAGRSRESDIRLDAAGQFWQGAERVEHVRMQRAFASWIAKHPDDGRFILTNGYDWTYFRVEDVPFFVTGAVPDAGGLRLSLTDGTTEYLEGPVWEGPHHALYTRVKGGNFDARFQPGVQAGLGDVLEERPAGLGLRAGARWIPVGSPPPEV